MRSSKSQCCILSTEPRQHKAPVKESPPAETSFRMYSCGHLVVASENEVQRVGHSHCCHSADRSLWLVYQIAGHCTSTVGKTVYDMRPGMMTGMAGAYIPRVMENKDGAALQRVSIKLEEGFIRRYFDDGALHLPEGLRLAMSSSLETPYQFESRCDPETMVVLQQLLQNPYNSPLGKMFAESRALDLACRALDSVIPSAPSHRSKGLSAQDAERIHYAKEIILADLSAPPPSITELARRVGVNEKKLKDGFKTLFENTIFAYHRKARMDYACKLMVEGELNVCGIAYAVGYANPSHFARSFHAQFGINPGEYMRSVRQRGYQARNPSILM